MWDTSETAETELTKVLIARGEMEFKLCQSRKKLSFGNLSSDFTDSPPLTEKNENSLEQKATSVILFTIGHDKVWYRYI